MKKRNLFSELMSGIEEMAAHREGKITLHSCKVDAKDAPAVSAVDIKKLRKKLNLSQAVFARTLRASPATYRNWEQKKSKPNAQAAVLIKLVEAHPDVITKLAEL